jgi:hypothetical protein
MSYNPNIYTSSKIKSAENVNTKTTNSGTGWVGNTWTGEGEDPERAYIRSSIICDVSSTVYFEFSYDGINWVSTFPVAGFTAGTFHEYHGADLGYRYFRVRVVFPSLPTSVQIHTWYSDDPPTLNSPLSQSISPDQDATTVKAVLHAEDKDNPGTFVQGKMTSDGAIRTSIVSALIDFEHDYYEIDDSVAISDRWDYYLGGAAGTKVAEILVTYKTTGKNEVFSAGKTLI